jgi:hypothetical protein
MSMTTPNDVPFATLFDGTSRFRFPPSVGIWERAGVQGAASSRLIILGGAAPEPPGYLKPNDEFEGKLQARQDKAGIHRALCPTLTVLYIDLSLKFTMARDVTRRPEESVSPRVDTA